MNAHVACHRGPFAELGCHEILLDQKKTDVRAPPHSDTQYLEFDGLGRFALGQRKAPFLIRKILGRTWMPVTLQARRRSMATKRTGYISQIKRPDFTVKESA
jgi:hypothetical protein